MMKRRQHKNDSRIKTLQKQAQELIGQTLAAVWYFDGTNDQGVPYFSIDSRDEIHELMQGADLVTSTGLTFSFRWEAFGKARNYELSFLIGSTADTLATDHPRFNISDSAHWNNRIGKKITTVVFSSPVGSNSSLCDCRIEFDGAPPAWICARCGSCEFKENGDDTIVVFTEQEARRLGIKTDA